MSSLLLQVGGTVPVAQPAPPGGGPAEARRADIIHRNYILYYMISCHSIVYYNTLYHISYPIILCYIIL